MQTERRNDRPSTRSARTVSASLAACLVILVLSPVVHAQPPEGAGPPDGGPPGGGPPAGSGQPAASLNFTIPPPSGNLGTVFSVEVEILNAQGTRIENGPSSAQPITLSIASGPAGSVLSGSNPATSTAGVATFNDMSIDRPGNFTLTATAGSVTTTSPIFKINGPPAPVGLTVSTHEDASLTGTLSATDPNGDPLTFTIDAQATQGTATITDPATGAYTYTPQADVNGPDAFTFRVSDGVLDATAVQTITIVAVNDAPSFTPGAPVAVFEDAGAQEFPAWATAISVGPPNEASQTIAFTLTTDKDALFSSPPAVSPEGTLTFTSAPDAFGSANVTIRATDSDGASTPNASFHITVGAVNDAPTIEALPDVSIIEDDGLQTIPLTGITVGGGPDEQIQTILVTASTSNASIVTDLAVAYDGDGTGTLTFTPAAVGTAAITVILTDDGAADHPNQNERREEFSVTVHARPAPSTSASPTTTITSAEPTPSPTVPGPTPIPPPTPPPTTTNPAPTTTTTDADPTPTSTTPEPTPTTSPEPSPTPTTSEPTPTPEPTPTTSSPEPTPTTTTPEPTPTSSPEPSPTPTTSEPTPDPTPTTSSPEPTPTTTTPEPTPTTSPEPSPTPTTSEPTPTPDPTPTTSSPEPTPTTTTPEPTPTTSPEPSATSNTPTPTPEPTPTTSSPEPTPTTTTPEPTPTTSPEPSPTPTASEPAPTSILPEPTPTPQSPDPIPTTTTPEPQPISPSPEPTPATSSVEPTPTSIAAEPTGTPEPTPTPTTSSQAASFVATGGGGYGGGGFAFHTPATSAPPSTTPSAPEPIIESRSGDDQGNSTAQPPSPPEPTTFVGSNLAAAAIGERVALNVHAKTLSTFGAVLFLIAGIVVVLRPQRLLQNKPARIPPTALENAMTERAAPIPLETWSARARMMSRLERRQRAPTGLRFSALALLQHLEGQQGLADMLKAADDTDAILERMLDQADARHEADPVWSGFAALIERGTPPHEPSPGTVDSADHQETVDVQALLEPENGAATDAVREEQASEEDADDVPLPSEHLRAAP